MAPALVAETARRLSSDLLVLFHKHQNDAVIAGVVSAHQCILDVLVQIMDDRTARAVFLPVFVPNMTLAIRELTGHKFISGNMLSFAEEEGRVNFLTSLLEVHILALRKSCSDSPEIVELMFQPFEVIADILRVSQNPNPVIKCSVCVKSYLLYYYPQVEQRKYGPKIYELLDRLLNPKEVEVLSYYVGNILMILFEKVRPAHQMPKNDIHNELLRKLVTKLTKCMLPSTVQGIALLFSRYFITNFEEMANFLKVLVIGGTKVGLKVVMDRWLLHQPRFIGRLTKNATFNALMVIFASKSPVFNDLLVLGFDPSHTRDSPEVYAPLKILSTLIRCYQNEKKATYRDLGADDMIERYRESMQDEGRLATYDDDEQEMDEEDGEDPEEDLGFGGMDVAARSPGSCAHPARHRRPQRRQPEEGQEGQRLQEPREQLDVAELHVGHARLRRDGQRRVRRDHRGRPQDPQTCGPRFRPERPHQELPRGNGRQGSAVHETVLQSPLRERPEDLENRFEDKPALINHHYSSTASARWPRVEPSSPSPGHGLRRSDGLVRRKLRGAASTWKLGRGRWLSQ